jgi:hypothetical protein
MAPISSGMDNIQREFNRLRLNMSINMSDIEENCRNLLRRDPDLKNRPSIIETSSRMQYFYGIAKRAVTVLIAHDFLSYYLVIGGPLSKVVLSVMVGALSMVGIYSFPISLVVSMGVANAIFGFVIVIALYLTCFDALPPKKMHSS